VSRCQAQRQLEVPQAPDCQVITAPEWDFATVLLHTYYDDDDSSSAAGYQPQPLACTHVSTSLITSLLPLKHAGFTYKHYFSHHPGPLLLHKNKKSPKLINNQRFESPLTLHVTDQNKHENKENASDYLLRPNVANTNASASEHISAVRSCAIPGYSFHDNVLPPPC
jgi:hypothetical protein